MCKWRENTKTSFDHMQGGRRTRGLGANKRERGRKEEEKESKRGPIGASTSRKGSSALSPDFVILFCPASFLVLIETLLPSLSRSFFLPSDSIP